MRSIVQPEATLSETKTEHAVLAAKIVAAYVSKNAVRPSDLPELVASAHAALIGLGTTSPASTEPEKPVPAVSIKKSVTPDFLICLDDGKKFKTLKRHLRMAYGMTPEEYRAKWGLPNDYPMVAPSYAEARSQLAKQRGLGTKRRKR